MIGHLWPITLAVLAYSIFISWLDATLHFEQLHLPISFAALPGAFVGVLLAFRTNSSYSRWWEARILWGKIVNDSRTLTRQLLTFVAGKDDRSNDLVIRMTHRQIAWCYALTRSLRRQSPLEDARAMVDDSEVSELRRYTNLPNALLLHQGRDLRTLREKDEVDAWQFVALEQTLGRLTDSMGGCERIRNTPFPPSYRTWIHYLIYAFICFLPFSFVDAPAIVMTLVTVPVAVGYLIVERVAMYLENPFSEAITGTPMSTISRTIEINLRQMLGETEVPPELKPENDVLL